MFCVMFRLLLLGTSHDIWLADVSGKQTWLSGFECFAWC